MRFVSKALPSSKRLLHCSHRLMEYDVPQNFGCASSNFQKGSTNCLCICFTTEWLCSLPSLTLAGLECLGLDCVIAVVAQHHRFRTRSLGMILYVWYDDLVPEDCVHLSLAQVRFHARAADVLLRQRRHFSCRQVIPNTAVECKHNQLSTFAKA